MSVIFQKAMAFGSAALTDAKDFVNNHKKSLLISTLSTAALYAAGAFTLICTTTCTGWIFRDCSTRCCPAILNFALENKVKVGTTAVAIGCMAQGKKAPKLLPAIGIIGGVATGVASRILRSAGLSLLEKSKKVCKLGFSGVPILQTINQLKQWEIKNCALLTPLLPLAVKIIYDAARSNNPNGIYAKLKEATGNNLSKEQLYSLIMIATLGLGSGIYGPMLGLNPASFDASGHMMLKIILADFLADSLGQLASKGGKLTQAMAAVYGALYAFTDAVLICNTVKACHTIPEIIGGIVWGISIRLMKRALPQTKPPNTKIA